MFRSAFAITALFVLLSGAPAHALSCAAPQLTAHTLESAAAIFEGVVVADRRDDVNIVPGAEEALDKNVSYSFLVSKAWKGVTDGETVTVRRNVYWGDGFHMGKAYLVFAERKDQDGVFLSGLCGLTTELEHADEYQKWLAANLPATVPAETPGMPPQVPPTP